VLDALCVSVATFVAQHMGHSSRHQLRRYKPKKYVKKENEYGKE
jgi:hypothetical protein